MAVLLLVFLVVLYYGFYHLSLQMKAENNLFFDMSGVMNATKEILEVKKNKHNNREKNKHNNMKDTCEQNGIDEKKIRQCKIKRLGVAPQSPCWSYKSQATCVYSVCVDKVSDEEGGKRYETYIRARLSGNNDLCDAERPRKGALETVWSTFKGIKEAAWGSRRKVSVDEKPVDEMSYEFCSDQGGCIEVYESRMTLDNNKSRIRILVSGLKTTYWGDDQNQNSMFLIALLTGGGMFFLLSLLFYRKVRQFGTQASRLRNRLEDQDQAAINDDGFTGELAEIATAADKRMASYAREADESETAARKIKERLMACAMQLGRGLSHNENALLARLNSLIDSVKSNAEKGRNVSPEQLRDVATANQGVRISLEDLSKQLIRWSIGDFSETGAAVDIGATLSNAIIAVKSTSKRDLIWTESVPELSKMTTQFEFFSIVVNLLDNAEKHANKNIEISAWDCGEVIEIVVEDDSPGFPLDEEAREALLKWGIRAGMYAHPDASGIGIGLALVAEWLRGGDGVIELSTSTKWDGALVRIRVRCFSPAG